MKTADRVKIDYYDKLIKDEEIVNILEEITETLYNKALEENKTHLHRRYVIDVAKKVAFCLRFIGYNVIEYKHGKLEVFIR